jgi:hypothetical protein
MKGLRRKGRCHEKPQPVFKKRICFSLSLKALTLCPCQIGHNAFVALYLTGKIIQKKKQPHINSFYVRIHFKAFWRQQK